MMYYYLAQINLNNPTKAVYPIEKSFMFNVTNSTPLAQKLVQLREMWRDKINTQEYFGCKVYFFQFDPETKETIFLDSFQRDNLNTVKRIINA